MDLLPDLIDGGFYLMVLNRAAGAHVIDLVARLALRGPVQVLDGGNCFNAYRCSRAIARGLGSERGGDSTGLEAVLERVRIARAFTCYQMVALLGEIPASPYPTVALDLLATFYDENVPLLESQRLVETCSAHLQRLGRLAPVLASVVPPPAAAAGRAIFVEVLAAAASQAWVLEPPPPPPPLQLELL